VTASYHPEAKGETVAISIKLAGKEMKIPKEFLFHEKRIHLRSIRILTTTLTGAPLGKDHLLWAGFMISFDCDRSRIHSKKGRKIEVHERVRYEFSPGGFRMRERVVPHGRSKNVWTYYMMGKDGKEDDNGTEKSAECPCDS